MKKNLNLKKILQSGLIKIRSFFVPSKKPSTLLDNLKRKLIATHVSAAVINESVYRPEGIKTNLVAVKTTEPPHIINSHAEWMLNIMMERAYTAARIGAIEQFETISNARKFYFHKTTNELINNKYK